MAYRATTGGKLWSVRHDAARGTTTSRRIWRSAPNGLTIYVTGTTRQSQSYYDYYTVAYRAGSGAVRWARRYDGPVSASQDDYDAASAIAVSPDGTRVYVTGESADLQGG